MITLEEIKQEAAELDQKIAKPYGRVTMIILLGDDVGQLSAHESDQLFEFIAKLPNCTDGRL